MTTDREVAYVTRESVKYAIDSKASARDDARVDACILAASRDAEGLTHRTFYPWTGTRYFPWPSSRGSNSWRLWLDGSELISCSALTSAGDPITAFFLEPNRYGPPFDRIEVNRATVGGFNGGDTEQRNIGVTGVFGYELRELASTTLAVLVNDSATMVTVTSGAGLGVGSLLRVGTERFQVISRAPASTTAATTSALDANKGQTTIPVDSGAKVSAGEIMLIDSERMLVLSVAGNNLTVKRAWDGTTLAAHLTAAPVYADRLLTVTRGALGTTAASHASADPVLVFQFPSLLQEYVTAAALAMLEQGSAAYARTAGSGDNERETSGRGVKAIEANLYRQLGRKGRIR